MLNHAAQHPAAPPSDNFVRAEVLMGASIIQPVRPTPHRSHTYLTRQRVGRKRTLPDGTGGSILGECVLILVLSCRGRCAASRTSVSSRRSPTSTPVAWCRPSSSTPSARAGLSSSTPWCVSLLSPPQKETAALFRGPCRMEGEDGPEGQGFFSDFLRCDVWLCAQVEQAAKRTKSMKKGLATGVDKYAATA